MLNQHIKINQLDVLSKKVSSNNDVLLIEKNHRLMVDGNEYAIQGIAQCSEDLIQGFLYDKVGCNRQCRIENIDGVYRVDPSPEVVLSLNPLDIHPLQLQHDHVVNWVGMFRDGQSLYRQTGATHSVGLCLQNKQIHTIECIDTPSAIYKMLGRLLKNQTAYYPVLLLSHRLMLSQVPLILKLRPAVLICQSAITASALSALVKENITVFGFCRKRKFNRYSNFHL